jgi:uncharacterized cupin superfamily protein
MTAVQSERALPRAADIDEIPGLWDGLMKLARSALGITAFGVQVLDLPPSYTTSAHDETASSQEELYVALLGEGELLAGDDAYELREGRLVVAPPACTRALRSGADGLRVLVVGGTPGRPYEIQPWTEIEEAGR